MISRRFWLALHSPVQLVSKSDLKCRVCHGFGWVEIKTEDGARIATYAADPVEANYTYKVGDRIPCCCTHPQDVKKREVTQLEELYAKD